MSLKKTRLLIQLAWHTSTLLLFMSKGLSFIWLRGLQSEAKYQMTPLITSSWTSEHRMRNMKSPLLLFQEVTQIWYYHSQRTTSSLLVKTTISSQTQRLKWTQSLSILKVLRKLSEFILESTLKIQTLLTQSLHQRRTQLYLFNSLMAKFNQDSLKLKRASTTTSRRQVQYPCTQLCHSKTETLTWTCGSSRT